MIDLPIVPLQWNKGDRSVEIVTIDVELVEEIQEVVFRRRTFLPEIALHVGITRIEWLGDLLGRVRNGRPRADGGRDPRR